MTICHLIVPSLYIYIYITTNTNFNFQTKTFTRLIIDFSLFFLFHSD